MVSCGKCELDVQEIGFVAGGELFHPDHFLCSECGQQISDSLISYKGRRLCEKCIPRFQCGGRVCSNGQIQSGELFVRLFSFGSLTPMHVSHHLCCSNCSQFIMKTLECDDAIGVSKNEVYLMRNGRHLCIDCGLSLPAEACQKCGQLLRVWIREPTGAIKATDDHKCTPCDCDTQEMTDTATNERTEDDKISDETQ